MINLNAIKDIHGDANQTAVTASGSSLPPVAIVPDALQAEWFADRKERLLVRMSSAIQSQQNVLLT